MSTLTLHLPQSLEHKLQTRAAAQGRDVASVALELVERGLQESAPTKMAHELAPEERLQAFRDHSLEKSVAATAPTQNPNELPYEVWRERFEAWVKKVPQVNLGFVDDSRESIYEER